MTANANPLIISPIGDIAPWISDLLARGIKKNFRLPARVVPVLDGIGFAYDSQRNQYHSTPILERLSAQCPEDGIKIIAVTREDLFIPILTHVYGEAQLGGRACIVSIARLLKGPDMGGTGTGAHRIIKEAVHELGHCFDLRHCRDSRCIMHYCRRLEEVDKKSMAFCRYCRIFLEDTL